MENSRDRAMHIAKLIDAPIDRMWQVWSEAAHIAQWWGPHGFTNTIQVMDFNEGGNWIFTMHGPDGTNYPNRSIFKEIIPFKKIVFEHFNPHFVSTILFQADGDKTWLDWTVVFDSVEMFEIIVKAHKADDGQKQNVERLEKYLTEIRK
jgi:uncharacterized protein YndB with AHSA1/START domain